jgi:hypothetical protein
MSMNLEKMVEVCLRPIDRVSARRAVGSLRSAARVG